MTLNEIHEACRWPPPDVVRANIQRATGGSLSTPTELYAKGKDALDRSQFYTIISDGESFLMGNCFYTRDDWLLSRAMATFNIPGFRQACTLLSRRLGLHFPV